MREDRCCVTSIGQQDKQALMLPNQARGADLSDVLRNMVAS